MMEVLLIIAVLVRCPPYSVSMTFLVKMTVITMVIVSMDNVIAMTTGQVHDVKLCSVDYLTVQTMGYVQLVSSSILNVY